MIVAEGACRGVSATQAELVRDMLTWPPMHSRDQVRVDLPIALDATTATRIASKTLYAAWIERSAYEGRVPWTWLLLEPTDVVDLTLDDAAFLEASADTMVPQNPQSCPNTTDCCCLSIDANDLL